MVSAIFPAIQDYLAMDVKRFQLNESQYSKRKEKIVMATNFCFIYN